MNALIFDNYIDLLDVISVLQQHLKPQKHFTLHKLSEESGAGSRLALTGYRKSGLSQHLDLSRYEGQLLVTKNKVVLNLPTGARLPCHVEMTHTNVKLLALLPLKPWSMIPPMEQLDPLLFWVNDSQIAVNLVKDHFKLNRDQIDFAVLEEAEHQSIVFKVHDPSYFLVQRYAHSLTSHLIDDTSNHHQQSVLLFYPLKPNVYVEWGSEPALAERWISDLKESSQATILLRMKLVLEPLVLEGLSWQSVYDLSSFELSADLSSHTNQWHVKVDHQLHFTIPMSLEWRSRSVEPELWLIEADSFEGLQQKLSLVDQEDLKSLLISVQVTGEGHQRFFLRERPGVNGSQVYLELGGQGFATYMGFHNLYLPIDVELQPRLRRDQYAPLFGLKHNELTVLTLNRGVLSGPNRKKLSIDQTKIERFSEQSFEPLQALVHYVISAASERIQSAEKRSVFNLSRYLDASSMLKSPELEALSRLLAPKIPNLSSSPQVKAQKSLSGGVASTPSKTQLERDPHPPLLSPAQEEKISVSDQAHQSSSTGLTEFKIDTQAIRRKRIAERLGELLKEDAHLLTHREDIWLELAELLKLNDELRQSIEASIEALWLFRRGQRERYHSVITRIREGIAQWYSKLYPKATHLSEIPLDEGGVQIIENDSNFCSSCGAIYALFLIEELPAEQRPALLSRLLSLTESKSSRWGKKAFWYFWSTVARLNQDQRLFARKREHLLNLLNEEGVTRLDLPRLIVDHLEAYKSLTPIKYQEEQEDDGLQTGELQLGIKYLEMIRIKLTGDASSDALRWLKVPVNMLLARSFHEHMLFKERDEALTHVFSGLAELTGPIRGWVLILLTRTQELIPQKKLQECNHRYHELVSSLTHEDQNRLQTLVGHISQRNQRKRSSLRAALSRTPVKQRLFNNFDPESHPELQLAFEMLEKSLLSTGVEEHVKHLKTLIDLMIRGLGDRDDLRPIAYYLTRLDEYSGKLKWSGESATCLELFDSLELTLKDHFALTSGYNFYLNLSLLTNSELQIKFGEEKHALNQIDWLLNQLSQQDGVWLDQLDSASVALRAIESISYEQREAFIENVSDGLIECIIQQHLRDNLLICNFLEQLVEVAMSKEKLTVNRFKDYCDQEELSLRDALLNDTL